MRTQTKLLKDILRREYPEANISVEFVECSNYADSSDKVRVTMNGASFMDVQTTLRHYTQNIAIYPHGSIAFASGQRTPAILDPESKTWVDADTLEFIEVKII